MNIVPGAGPPNAKIMLVGEAPGSEEDRVRKPFVGAAGNKLNECLHTAQIPRTGIYITNVVKERPPANNISAFITFGRGEPKRTERYDAYVEMLKEEILRVKPNVICALGNTALYALTGETSITNWRGSILESTLVPGMKVIPTIHPAAALRQYIFTHYITHDLIKVKRESESPELSLPNPNMKLRPTLSEALQYLEECMSLEYVAVDIEVVSQEIECLAFAKSARDSCCIVLYDGAPVFTEEEEVVLWNKIAELLENPNVSKIFQNAVFDVTFIYERYSIMTVNIEDTMIMQGLITPDLPKSLAFIASIYTNFPFYKEEGKEWYKNPAGSPEGFWKYNCLDTLVTYEAFSKLSNDIVSSGLMETYQSHLDIISPIVKMQHRGIKMDASGMEKESKECDEKLVELKAKLNELAGMDLNANSPKQLQNYFYVNKGIRPYVKGGKPTTDEKAMMKIALKGFEEAKIVLDIRRLRKLKSTYLDVDLDGDRLKCSYNPIGTTTGRLSSSKNIFGKGTNLQNQPASMKKFMLVDKGYIGFNFDLSGADSRNVAFCGPVPVMRDAYLRGADIHRLTASLIFGKPPEEISSEPGSSDIGNGLESERYWGKKMNHSSNYGIGFKELAYRLMITEKEAKDLLNAYHSAYPEVRSGYQAQIVQMLRNGRRVTNPFGRTRLFLDRWGEPLFQDAYAYFSQSAVADIINRWGLAYIDKIPEVELLNQIHDSLVFQISKDVEPKRIVEILTGLRESLGQPLHWRSVTYNIPTDMEAYTENFYDKIKLTAPLDVKVIEDLMSN